MRCYLTAESKIVATQAEAGEGFFRLDLPDDKTGLISRINGLIEEGRDLGRAEVTARAKSAVAATPVHLAPAARIATLTDVEEFIQAADHRQLVSITENAILRMRELAKAAGL